MHLKSFPIGFRSAFCLNFNYVLPFEIERDLKIYTSKFSEFCLSDDYNFRHDTFRALTEK